MNIGLLYPSVRSEQSKVEENHLAHESVFLEESLSFDRIIDKQIHRRDTLNQ